MTAIETLTRVATECEATLGWCQQQYAEGVEGGAREQVEDCERVARERLERIETLAANLAEELAEDGVAV